MTQKNKTLEKDANHEKAKELGLSHRKGNVVHAGLAVKGGAGYRGVVTKIDDDYTWINIGKGKYGDRVVKAPHRLVTKEEVEMKKNIGEGLSETDKEILSELSIKTLKSYQQKTMFKPNRTKGFYKAEKQIKDKNNPIDNPKIHDLTHMHDDGEVYDHTQTAEHINDGDILKLHGGRTAMMYSAWPTMISGESEHLHSLNPGHNFPMPRYKKSVDLEKTVNKVKTEEVISELSNKTLKSYVKKAKKSSERLWNKVNDVEDKAMSTDGMKYPEKQNKFVQQSINLAKNAKKRDKGIDLATKKLREDITESVSDEQSLVSKLINKFKK